MRNDNKGLIYILIAVIVLLLMWWNSSDKGRLRYINDLESQIAKYEDEIEELKSLVESQQEVMEAYDVY